MPLRTVRIGDEVKLGLRLPRALHDQLEQVAVEHSSSVSAAVRHLLRRGLVDFDAELASRRVTPDLRLRT